MPARKRPRIKISPGRGRPSSYKEEYVKIAHGMALLGLTDHAIAKKMAVPMATFQRWVKAHPEFRAALSKGREQADQTVANSLFRRANGYKHRAKKIFYDSKTGQIVEAPYTERYAPDTNACIFWLKNRQPELWKDKTAQEISGTGPGGAIPVEVQTGLAGMSAEDIAKLRDLLAAATATKKEP